ncbi:MAG TPA: hypothetical protein VFT27_12480 [Actinomycetota bacterium]|nr:hypothetical protein [Actinomycetota bacterium]
MPVRGSVLGTECLPEPFGPDVPTAPHPGSTPLQLAAGVGLIFALLGTLLPWARFGVGSGAFGAWGQPIRWATLTVIAALLGIGAWGIRRALLHPPHALDTAVAVLGGLSSLGAMLSIWHPPAFSPTWIGPWVTLFGGAIACASTVVEIRGRRRAAVAA